MRITEKKKERKSSESKDHKKEVGDLIIASSTLSEPGIEKCL